MAIRVEQIDGTPVGRQLPPWRSGPGAQRIEVLATDKRESPHLVPGQRYETCHWVIISHVAETDLDTIRASYVALNQGDVQAALDALHREAVWRETPELPGGDDFEGRAAIERFLVGYLEQWDVFHQQVESTLSRGDRVLVNIRMTAVGRESGAEVSARYVDIWKMRDGRGAEVDAYYDAEMALHDALGAQRLSRSEVAA